MIFGQTITGKRYNNGHQSVTLRRDTTTLGSGGNLTTTGEGTNQSVSRNTTGRYASNAIAFYREAESVNSDNTITYTYTDLEGWQATSGQGTTSGSRSWSFSYRPPEVIEPVYTVVYPYDLPSYIEGTGYLSVQSVGSYGDNYSAREAYNPLTQTWSMVSGAGVGSGHVNSFQSSWIDTTAYLGVHLEMLFEPDGSGYYEFTGEYVKHYGTGSYASIDVASKGSSFTASFMVVNGEWKSVFTGTDHENTYKNYAMSASGTGSSLTNPNATVIQTQSAKGNETMTTSLETHWSTISGTKQTTSTVSLYTFSRDLLESSWQTDQIYGQNRVHGFSRSASLSIFDKSVTDANAVQQKTYSNNATANRVTYDETFGPLWSVSHGNQTAIMSKISPSAPYDTTNTITWYRAAWFLPGPDSGTNTVTTCDLSLSGSGINSHYTHAAITYVNSVELTFGANGASVTFGGPTAIPGGFTSENFDQDIPKPPPAIPLDMSGISGPIDPTLWNTMKAVATEGTWGLGSGAKGITNGAVKSAYRTLTLGLTEDINGPFTLNEWDLAMSADWSEAIADGSVTILTSVGAGMAGCVGGKVGQAIKLHDIASNIVGVSDGVEDILENGLTVQNSFQTLASGLGLTANAFSKCFTAGTQVIVGQELTEDGLFVQYVTVNIEDVKVGDWVYSYDTTTGEVSQRQVTATFERRSDHLNYLTIIDAKGKEQTLETTDGHPFWVVTDNPDLSRAAREVVDENGVILYHENLAPGLNGFWVEAKDLKVGDVFLGVNGELSTLTNIVRIELEEEISVFNFSVEGNHNYFVLAKEYEYGQSSILVHNAIFYKAPQGSRSKEQIMDELRNGFDPKKYPGEGVFVTDNLAIAQKYEKPYGNGIQKFTMDDDKFKLLQDKKIMVRDGWETDSWQIKGPENIKAFNDALDLPGKLQ